MTVRVTNPIVLLATDGWKAITPAANTQTRSLELGSREDVMYAWSQDDNPPLSYVAGHPLEANDIVVITVDAGQRIWCKAKTRRTVLSVTSDNPMLYLYYMNTASVFMNQSTLFMNTSI